MSDRLGEYTVLRATCSAEPMGNGLFLVALVISNVPEPMVGDIASWMQGVMDEHVADLGDIIGNAEQRPVN